MSDEELNGLTERIIGCAYKVANTLGCGFLEKVYENALAHELRKSGLRVETQKPIQVLYDGVLVGEYCADLLVEDAILLELKATKEHNDVFTAVCLNYLKATGKPLCLLLNFGMPRLDYQTLSRALISILRIRVHLWLLVLQSSNDSSTKNWRQRMSHR